MLRSLKESMRSIVITGASSGIGAALARLCLERGWNVLAVARRAERLAELSRNIRTAPCSRSTLPRPGPHRGSSTKRCSDSRALTSSSTMRASRTPGCSWSKPMQRSKRNGSCTSPRRCASRAPRLPHVREQRGGFVFIGSGLARVPAPGYGAYAPAKAAIRAASIQLRRELRPQGVFVTYVDPGVVDTEFSTASGMQPHAASWHAKPEGVAKAILRGIERRASRVNAVWWQTAGTVAGEWFPALADAAMAQLVHAAR